MKSRPIEEFYNELIFEDYKEIVRRLYKANFPLQGVPELLYYFGSIWILVKLDPTRTPRLNKLMRIAKKYGLKISGYRHDLTRGSLDLKVREKILQYQYKIFVGLDD